MKRLLIILIAFLVVACTSVNIQDMSFQDHIEQVNIPETYEVYAFGESHHSGGDWYYKQKFTIRNENLTSCAGQGWNGFDTVQDADCQYALTMGLIVDALNPGNVASEAASSKLFSDRVCYYPVTILQRVKTIGNYEALVCFDEKNRIVTFISPIYGMPSANSWHLKDFPISGKIYDFIISVDKQRNLQYTTKDLEPSKKFDKLNVK
ncbi:hypothetical protein KY338_06830 [Candidatus Woesearchaeota archaeon]|nr:hypothetical protein [Candidatus Woesearchaeota archaeon]MBW3006381.1 hypothetical protein [Candidatus Woesearchaeota archaeon]